MAENYLHWNENQPIKLLLKNWKGICAALWLEWRKGGIRLKDLSTATKKLITAWFQAGQIDQWLQKNQINGNDAVFYSFWFYDCTYMAALKQKYPQAKFITRTHSGDLYENGLSLMGKVLLRNFQIKNLDAVVTISAFAKNYLGTQYPEHKEKYHLHRLGTAESGFINPFEPEGPLVLVSCSHVRNVKRVHIIAQALQLCRRKIIWMHMGSVEASATDNAVNAYHKAIEELQKFPNVDFHYLGNLEPAAVMDFYKNNPVHALISTSETEGIPVSMMEAISVGIPIISTDVGACNEIVTSETGILFPENEGLQSIADIIEKFADSNMNTTEFRQGVRKFWEENYSAENNYKRMATSMENWGA